MSDVKEQILHDVKRIIEEEEKKAIQINCDNGQTNDTSVEKINELVNIEVAKAVTFYMSKNKINSEQSSENN